MSRAGLLLPVVLSCFSPIALAQAGGHVFRVGIIGLDTSHVIAFTQLLNDPNQDWGCKVVAGYRGGSPDVQASASRVEGFTNQLRDKFDLEIVDSIEELCTKIDGILLESVDGRPHLEQVKPAIAAKKPSSARINKEPPETVQTRADTGTRRTSRSGRAAPITKLPAEANAACIGRALIASVMPNSSRAWAPRASLAINWVATCLASPVSSPRAT